MVTTTTYCIGLLRVRLSNNSMPSRNNTEQTTGLKDEKLIKANLNENWNMQTLFYMRFTMRYARRVRLLLRQVVCLSVSPSVCSSVRRSALGDDTQDRPTTTLCHEAVTQFEGSRVEALEHERAVNSEGTCFTAQQLGVWPCDCCSRVCSSRIGLHAHQQTHRWHAILCF